MRIKCMVSPLEYNIEYGGNACERYIAQGRRGLLFRKHGKNFVKRQSKEQSTTAIFSSAKVLIL